MAENAAATGVLQSYWQRIGDMPVAAADASETPALPDSVDYVVVGGGFAGLATAVRMAEMSGGARIAVLEAKGVGYGASGRNGGLMSPLPAPIWLFSAANDPEHREAMGDLNRLVAEAASWLAAMAPDAEVRPLPLALEAKGRVMDAGIEHVARVLERAGIGHRLEQAVGAQRFRTLWVPAHTVNPYRVVLALACEARRLGVTIHERTSVSAIGQWPGSRDAEITLGDGRTIRARSVVLATNAYTPSVNLEEPPKAKVMHNYMVATKPLSDELIRAIGGGGKFVVELNKAYVFYRVHDRRLVFGGIEKFSQNEPGDLDVPAKIMMGLRRHLAETLPAGALAEIAEAWGGRFHMSRTDLPIIRRSRATPALVYNVAYGGTGVALSLTLAPVAAALALEQPVTDARLRRVHEVMARTGLPVAGFSRFALNVGRGLVSGMFAPKRG
ncbi:MAG: FAD-binding oxidoreductase [Hyphomicrobiaceae bacterium]|nr:FAD-binding oxidoreductase [Hyphomicrobiaceae bacterium]